MNLSGESCPLRLEERDPTGQYVDYNAYWFIANSILQITCERCWV